MPRTLDAALLAAMNSGVFTPYFKVELLDSDRAFVIWSTEEVLGFELDGLHCTVEFHDPNNNQDWYCFRIKRGCVIGGVPNYVTSSAYWPYHDRHEKRRRTLSGHLFPDVNYSTAGDVTYHQIIDTICANFGFTVTFENPAAAWLNYQFLETGRTLTLMNARYFFTMLRVKYLIFACDYDNNGLFFFQAHTTAPAWPAGYTLLTSRILKAPGLGATKFRSFVSKDESDALHTSGTATDPIHNLGFLHSTAAHPGRTWWIDTLDWVMQGIPPNLKYLDFDALSNIYDVVYQNIWPCKVRELYSPDLDPSWQFQARFLDVFGDTEGGTLPATSVPALIYTPLNTSGFHAVLDSQDSNLQVAMDTLDDHTHIVSRASPPTIEIPGFFFAYDYNACILYFWTGGGWYPITVNITFLVMENNDHLLLESGSKLISG
jgi:hypothetical protein